MHKKFREALVEACKDMGLTEKAIDELVALGVKSLKADASDDELSAAVDSLVPFAKAMQAEITRKTSSRKDKQSTKPSVDAEEGGNEGNKAEEIPHWFAEQMKSINDNLSALKAENDALKAERNSHTRSNLISAKAKELGIPEYLMKRVSFADDADYEKELTEYKQDLVTNGLMPKEAEDKGTIEAQMKAEAEAWAKSLPNN